MKNFSNNNYHKIFCIVSTGQSGSSLLAAILAKSGANFSMPVIEKWNPTKGSMEHPFSHESYKQLSRLKKIKSSIIPRKLIVPFLYKKFNEKVNLLGELNYIKSSTLVWLVPHLAHRKNKPKVIIIFREFQQQAQSKHKKFGTDYLELKKEYVNIYATTLLQLQQFGGVVIGYKDLLNINEIEWATAVEKLTGIKKEKLLKNRASLLSPKIRKQLVPKITDTEIETLEGTFVKLKNRVIIPKTN